MKENVTVQELANYWHVSTNTVWKRLNKLQKRLLTDDEQLIIVKKPINNRETTVITISDNLLNEFTVNNTVNNGVNNGDYEELLTVDNVNNNLNNVNNNVNNPQNSIDMQEIITQVINYSEQLNTTVNDVHKHYNQQIMNIHEQLMNEKSKIPLLEDKANREGLYLAEIQELKKVNNRNLRLFTFIVIGLITLLIVITTLLIYNLLNPKTITNTVIKEVPKEVIKYVRK